MTNEKRELADARATIARLELELARLDRAPDWIDPNKDDAEALRALAAWVNAGKGWRRVSGICSGERFEFEVTIRFWRGTDGQQEVWGEADTLAGAIMDALSKARDDASAKWDFGGEGATLAAAIMDALRQVPK
jgi:hypothetical protein